MPRGLYREVEEGERGLRPRRKVGDLTLVPISQKNFDESMAQFYNVRGVEIVSPEARPGLSVSATLSRIPLKLTAENAKAVPLGEEFLELGEGAHEDVGERIWATIGRKYKDEEFPVRALVAIEEFRAMLVAFKFHTRAVIKFYETVLRKAGATAEHFAYYQKYKTPLEKVFEGEEELKLLDAYMQKFYTKEDIKGNFRILKPFLQRISFFRQRGIPTKYGLVNPFLLYDALQEMEADFTTLLALREQERASSAELVGAVNAELARAAAARPPSRAATPGFLPRAASHGSHSSAGSPSYGPASRYPSGEPGGAAGSGSAVRPSGAGGAAPGNNGGSPVPPRFYATAEEAAAAAMGSGLGNAGDLTPGLSPMAAMGPVPGGEGAASPFSPSIYEEVPLLRQNYEHGGGQRTRRRNRKTRRQTKSTKAAFWPPKYFKGLSKRAKTLRKREIQKFGAIGWKNPAAYKGFQTNLGVQTRPSSYTEQWNAIFPGVKSLEDRAKVTGVPLQEIRESYNRGMAAWRTGHRPGATQQQWGYARVSSFLLCGKTHFTTDSDLVRRAKQRSAAARSWWKKQCAS